jgi:hypothetical protein
VANTHFPNVSFAQGFARLGDYIDYQSANSAFGFQDMLSLIRGRRNLKIGAEYLRHRDNERGESNAAGTSLFQPGDGVPATPRPATRLPAFCWAPSIVPAPCSTPLPSVHAGTISAPSFRTISRSTSRLTLNLGVRWEVQSPFTDPQDRMSIMDPGLSNSVLQLAWRLRFAGSGSRPRRL